MWNARVTIVVLILGLGLLGTYFGVRGQDTRLPWPPPPVVPPASSQKPESPQKADPPKSQVRLPPSKPVKAAVTPNPIVPVRFEAKVPAAGPPIKVEPLPPPAPVPSMPPGIPMPAPPPSKAASEDKSNEPLIVLPPTENAVSPDKKKSAPDPLPAPFTVPANEPLLPAAPTPKSTTVPDIAVAPAAIPESTNPGKPRAFQLVNPIRRQENSPPPDVPAMPPRTIVQAQPVAQTTPLAFPDAAKATPQVTVEKRGPVSARPGERLPFTIILRNVGPAPANQVRVEDMIPSGTRMTGAEPQPLVQGDHAVWIIPVIAAGGEKQLSIELTAPDGGDIASSTRVLVMAAAAMHTRIEQARSERGALSLSVKAATAVPAGSTAVFEVQVSNHSQQKLTGLVLHGSLPVGLTHPAGKEIEADVGDLGPGATKTYKMPVKAVQPGRHTIDVRINAPHGPEAGGQGTVQVIPSAGAGVTIKQSPSVKLFLDKEAELRFDVTNHGPSGLKNVAVLDTLPEGVEFIAASDLGLFRAEARTAHWLINDLAPGQTKTLALRVRAKAAGDYANDVTARTDLQQLSQSSAKLRVEGVADLAVKVSDRDNAIEVGKPTVYEIMVTNQGNAPATGIQVQAALSDGLAPSQARGPTRNRLDSRQVVFAPLAKLQPRGQAVYYVTALAQATGEQRCRAEVFSDQASTPIVREQRTLVYRD